MVIDLIVNHRSIALHKPTKYRRSLEHVDIIMGADHAKKQYHIHRSCDATASRMTIRSSACSLYCLFHANRQFFHSNACNQYFRSSSVIP
jgi:hypothetical protein